MFKTDIVKEKCDKSALALNALVPYYSMFPLEFPLKHLMQAKPGEWVLDPFCGRGTTNYAARLLGLPTAAVDCNPVAVAITEAKMVDVEANLIVEECVKILSNNITPMDIPSGEFWDWAYHTETLRELCRLREALLINSATPVRKALRGIILGVLHGPRNKGTPSYLSNQMPRTYATKPAAAVRYWKRKELKPVRIDFVEVVKCRAHHAYGNTPPAVENRVIFADVRELDKYNLPKNFYWVVTSPPYPGMRSYYPDQWLRNWFLGGKDAVEYNTEGQIGRFSGSSYIKELALAWRSVAALCVPGARLIVRFGALPSVKCSPLELLSESFAEAGCGWRILSYESAGSAGWGRRQAEQFNSKIKKAENEIDVIAVLE